MRMKYHKFALLLIIFCSMICSNVSADLLVGSWQTHSIRRYDDFGNYVGDFVPPGDGGLFLPDGMDFGADGHLYVASSNSNQVLRYNGQTGTFIDAFIDTGLNAPGNLQFGPDGFLYVCDKNTGRVLRFDPNSGSLDSVFASGGGLTNPVGLLWKDDMLYVSDFAGGAIRRFNANTGEFVDNFTFVASPLILNTDAAGNVLVSSHSASNILRFDCDGNAIGNFLNGGPVNCPVGHLFAPNGETWVASWGNHRLLRYDSSNGEFIAVFSSGLGLFLPNDLLQLPNVLPGDVNQDGVVDLLDVAPFTELLTNGQFQAEADINQDGTVDLLDVKPFVSILIN